MLALTSFSPTYRHEPKGLKQTQPTISFGFIPVKLCFQSFELKPSLTLHRIEGAKIEYLQELSSYREARWT